MSTNLAIVVENLTKEYASAKKTGAGKAVDGISFNVKEGEFFALLGPNGAGKTTTISILTTTLSKTEGKVTINGFDIDKQSSQVRRSVGIIFQNPSLDLNLTAEENIRIHAVLYGIYPFRLSYGLMPESYKKRVKELSEILGINADIFKPIKTFSGGMKRKLEIIRSLMHRPKVLFLDEPTVGLDPLSRKNLWEYLKQVRSEEKTTVFLTTHYLDEAEEADHVVIINKGKLVMEGTPAEIKRKMVDEYVVLGSKEREKLKQELDKKGLNLQWLDKEVKVHLRGSDIPALIQSIKTPLNKVEINTPTLEDAYLSIVGTENKEEEDNG